MMSSWLIAALALHNMTGSVLAATPEHRCNCNTAEPSASCRPLAHSWQPWET